MLKGEAGIYKFLASFGMIRESLDSAFGVATNYVIANWPDKSHTVQP